MRFTGNFLNIVIERKLPDDTTNSQRLKFFLHFTRLKRIKKLQIPWLKSQELVLFYIRHILSFS